jgi:NAD(P)-dependent dehydrogenase (short-subunit alcohol dehydrogenase family)
MTSPLRFADRPALVTGAGSGIGRATALLLAREGARVAVTDVNAAAAEATAAAITAAGGTALAQALDVTAEKDWATAVARVEQAWGPLAVVVNSAGVAQAAPLTELSLAEWRRVLAINLDGVFLGTRAALRSMARTGRGSVVNVASASGIKAAAGAAAYCASKAAVLMLTRTAALECNQAGHHVRVNAVAPGGVKTPLWDQVAIGEVIKGSPQWAAAADAPAAQRFATPEEVAQVIAFLASDEAAYVTGAVLPVDAGYTA